MAWNEEEALEFNKKYLYSLKPGGVTFGQWAKDIGINESLLRKVKNKESFWSRGTYAKYREYFPLMKVRPEGEKRYRWKRTSHLRDVRVSQGWSIDALASATGVNKHTLANADAGRSYLTERNRVRVEQVLGVELDMSETHLNKDEVIDILTSPLSTNELCKKYNRQPSTIYDIRQGRRYKEIHAGVMGRNPEIVKITTKISYAKARIAKLEDELEALREQEKEKLKGDTK